MPNLGTLTLSLLSVDGSPGMDPGTFVFVYWLYRRKASLMQRDRCHPAPLYTARVSVEGDRVFGDRSYGQSAVGVFTLTDGETIQRDPTVFWKPDKWQTSYDIQE